jgi:Mor family transcriptional regulator
MKQPNEKTERNLELVKDSENGMSVVDMVVKYRISPQRIYAIIRRHFNKPAVVGGQSS